MPSTILSMQQKIDKVRRIPSIHELGSLIRDFPELMISSYGFNTILQTIPHLVKEKETDISFYFIDAVIAHQRKRDMGAFKEMVYDKALQTNLQTHSSRDACYTVLKLYIQAMVEKIGRNGDFINRLVKNYDNYMRGIADDPRVMEFSHDYSMMEYLGFIFLLLNYTGTNTLDMWAKEVLFKEESMIRGFLYVFADIGVPLSDKKAACNAIADIWAHSRESEDEISDACIPQSSDDILGTLFLRKCMYGDTTWLCDKLDKYEVRHEDGSHGPLDSEDIEDCVNLYTTLSTVLFNEFTRVNYFFNYIAYLSIFYPLWKQRSDIIDRYERYFGDFTPIAAEDFMGEVVAEYSKCHNYRSDPYEKIASNYIKRKAEHLIMKLHRLHPEVSERVVVLFFEDLCKAYGRGFNGAAPGCMLTIEPMIHEIWSIPIDEPATESFDYLAEMAFEGSYGDAEDITEPKSSNNQSQNINRDDNRDNDDKTVSTTRLTRRADEDTSKLKAGERKIYAAFKKYKETEDKVDNVLQKGIATIKRVLTGDQQAVIIEGKKFSPIGFLKKAIVTVGIFNFSKIAGILYLITSHVLKKKSNASERKKLLGELERELVMINEKLEDARGDGNREAKYNLMRTKMAYEEAIRRIKLGVGAEGVNTAISKDSQERIRQNTNRTGYVG